MTSSSHTKVVSAAAVHGNVKVSTPTAPVAKQPIKKQSAASILSSFTSVQTQKTSVTKTTSLDGLPRKISPPLEIPDQERLKGRHSHSSDMVVESTKKALPSTKSSFEHFKRQAMEKSERVRDVSLNYSVLSKWYISQTFWNITTNNAL